jgi:hypothetical protein
MTMLGERRGAAGGGGGGSQASQCGLVVRPARVAVRLRMGTGGVGAGVGGHVVGALGHVH